MAGIGFEIKKILRRGSFLSIIQAYGLASIIGSGPWVLSILSVLIIGIVSQELIEDNNLVVQFLVCVAYLMATSLIVTGVVQLMFTRFISDRLYENDRGTILPNLMGMLWIVTCVSAGLSLVILLTLFDETFIFTLLMMSNFVVICNVWIVLIFLSSMKNYWTITIFFVIGYSIAIGGTYIFSIFNIEGLLFSVLLGHSFLLFGFLFVIIRNYPGSELVRFDFFDRKKIFISLAFTGFFFNMSVWLDKFIFWYYPQTSQQIIGPLRASIIYDLPIFLAYLSVIPGMAVFLVRMEADFAAAYEKFYNAIRDGDTLERINLLKNEMTYISRQGIYEIFKVQGIVVALLLIWGRDILELVGISQLYAPLFYIDAVAVSVQVLLLSVLNLFFYLDSRMNALFICGLFMVLNGILTALSIHLGVEFYGFGYATAITITTLVGLGLLSNKMYRLEYETFMLR